MTISLFTLYFHSFIPALGRIPSELVVFSPGIGTLSPKYRHHSERQLRRLQKLRASAQSTAIAQKTSTTPPVNPSQKTPPSLKELRAITRPPADKRQPSQPAQKTSYAAVLDNSEAPVPAISASPNPSISTITESQSQSDTNILPFNRSKTLQAASSVMILFRQETEKELSRQAQETVTTLQLFRTELTRENNRNAEFQQSLVTAQQTTTLSISALQGEQQSTNQRLQALETNMAITVRGIEALLKNQGKDQQPNTTSNSTGSLPKQGQDP